MTCGAPGALINKTASIGHARAPPAQGLPAKALVMPVLGLLMLQTRFPRPRGDVGHPSTFDFEVRRHVVVGATPERVVHGRDVAALSPFIAAPQTLVAGGCESRSLTPSRVCCCSRPPSRPRRRSIERLIIGKT